MLTTTKRQKGKKFEKFVARKLKKIFKYVYSRADSGSGKEHKEDITLPDFVPLFIECKAHKKKNLKTWWEQTINGCPASKIPILIYKLNYQKDPTVVMTAIDFIEFVSGEFKYRISYFEDKYSYYSELAFLIEFPFSAFLKILKKHYENKN